MEPIVTTPPLLVRRIEIFQFFEMTTEGSSFGIAVEQAQKWPSNPVIILPLLRY